MSTKPTPRTYRLFNTLHGTEAWVRPTRAKALIRSPGYAALSHSQVMRARRKLCGVSGCNCGGLAGELGGPLWVALQHEDDLKSRNIYRLRALASTAARMGLLRW